MRGFFAGSALQVVGTDFVRGLPKCGSCGFATKCNSPRLPVAGKGESGILFVKEHPGDEEDRTGKPYTGETDKLLKETLSSLGHRLSDSWLTFSMICRPTGEFTDKNINACRPALLTNVDELKPKVVVLLGPAPVRSLVPAERGGSVGAHDRWTGWRIPSNQHGAWLCPTYSPLQVARYGDDPTVRMFWREHLQTAYSLVKKEPVSYSIDQMFSKVEVVRSPRLAVKRLEELARKRGVLAFDYESNRIKPDHERARLYAASFCLDGEDTFSFPIHEESYVELLEAISPVLKNPDLLKVASNLKNEERWTKSEMGHWVSGWHWDTMNTSHVLDNRGGISSIKFQLYVRYGVADYDRFVEPYWEEGPDGFNRIHELDEGDMCRYCGVDSLAEYIVAIDQRREFGFHD